jgi:hypothetical protein
MQRKIDETELQLVWGSVRHLRRIVNAGEWGKAAQVYQSLAAYERTASEQGHHPYFINMAREAIDYYVESYNAFLKGMLNHA